MPDRLLQPAKAYSPILRVTGNDTVLSFEQE